MGWSRVRRSCRKYQVSRPLLIGRATEFGTLHSMQREPVIETTRMSLWYLPHDNIVFHQMHQYPGKEILEKVLLKGLEVLRSSKGEKWLSDDREGGALPRSHHEWGDQYWAPRAIAAGWKYWALLPPTETLGNTNMTRLVEAYARRGVTVQIFTELTKAHFWLKKQGSRAGTAASDRSPTSAHPGALS